MSPCFHVSRLSLCLCLALFAHHASADESEALADKLKAVAISAQSIESNKDSNLRPVVLETERKLVMSAYLRTRLPESAIAYARVPNIWSALGTASNDVLDSANGSQAFVNATRSIKEGFVETLIPEFPQGLRQLVELVLQHTNSPIEAVALKSAASGPLPANLLITTAADFESLDVLKEILTEIASRSPKITIQQALDEDGFSEIIVDDLKVQIVWSKTLSRLFFFIGQGATKESVISLATNLKLNESHTMLVAEKDIDDSEQGSFLWVDPPQLISIAKKIGFSSSDLSVLSTAGVNTMSSAAVGIGSHNGINHLKLAFDMQAMGLRALIPSIDTFPTFNLNGKTSLVATLGLPEKSHIMAYETMMSMGSPDSMEDYNQFKKAFAETAGFKLEDIFDFFGQDVSIVVGESGTFVAMRLNDETAFKTVLEKSVKDFNLAYEQREISGHTYHHLQLPNISLDEAVIANLTSSNGIVAKRLLSVPTHLYWEQEGEYLIIASLPQTLMDRHNVSPSVPANEWLKDTQRVVPDGALRMVSAVTEGFPASVYRTQLSMLSFFGDLTERPVDLFKLPTPREAKLPKQGTYGLKLTSSDTGLAIELSFEDNPFELFGGSTYLSTAVAGAAALIGISAQEEYEKQQVRQKVAVGFTAAKSVSDALDQYKTKYGNYPDQATIDLLDLERQEVTYTLSIEDTTGIVKIEYHINKYLGGDDQLILQPPSGESLEWTCESDIFSWYLPELCL